jgi:hypothetical protein
VLLSPIVEPFVDAGSGCMTHHTNPLGSREDPRPPVGRDRILSWPRPGWSRPRRDLMADLAYALLLVGGFAVLALTLRGLQRL